MTEKEKARIASYPRVESGDYNIQFANNVYDSLEIIECIDDHVESAPYIPDKRRKSQGTVYLHKKFLCKCYLCGREHEVLSSDFWVRKDLYGSMAKMGYYSGTGCDCRNESSSFQWRTVKILYEHNIPYRVEASFPDLLSEEGNPLRYDFIIYNTDGSIKCLIECQGEQHFKLVKGYGGYSSLERRQKHDEMKREYAKKHNIKLIEIHYKYNSYEKEEEYLREMGLFQ